MGDNPPLHPNPVAVGVSPTVIRSRKANLDQSTRVSLQRLALAIYWIDRETPERERAASAAPARCGWFGHAPTGQPGRRVSPGKLPGSSATGNTVVRGSSLQAGLEGFAKQFSAACRQELDPGRDRAADRPAVAELQ